MKEKYDIQFDSFSNSMQQYLNRNDYQPAETPSLSHEKYCALVTLVNAINNNDFQLVTDLYTKHDFNLTEKFKLYNPGIPINPYTKIQMDGLYSMMNLVEIAKNASTNLENNIANLDKTTPNNRFLNYIFNCEPSDLKDIAIGLECGNFDYDSQKYLRDKDKQNPRSDYGCYQEYVVFVNMVNALKAGNRKRFTHFSLQADFPEDKQFLIYCDGLPFNPYSSDGFYMPSSKKTLDEVIQLIRRDDCQEWLAIREKLSM